MLFTRCQTTIRNHYLKHYLIRNSLIYIPIANNIVTNLNFSNLNRSSRCAINQFNTHLNSLTYNGNDRESNADNQLSTNSSRHSKFKLENFKLVDLSSFLNSLTASMEADNLVNSLKKAFKNENVNEIIGLHRRMSNQHPYGKLNKQNFESNLNQKFKKSELLDSTILSKVKHVYNNTLNKLRFCSYHLKVRNF